MPFFAYANRDSLKYRGLYGLNDVRNILRCTLRHPGWCEFIEALLFLKFLENEPVIDCAQTTAASFSSQVLGQNDSLKSFIREQLKERNISNVIDTLQWLGLFNEKKVLNGSMSPIDFIVELSLDKMSYQPGEEDMIVLHNHIEVEFPEGMKDMKITLVDFHKNDDSAMARTVSLPVAIATELILENKIPHTGVQIPIFAEIYLPMMKKLKQLGMQFFEKL